MIGRENRISHVSCPEWHWQLLILERMTPPSVLEPEFVSLHTHDKAAH
jgi:hypothetical protein